MALCYIAIKTHMLMGRGRKEGESIVYIPKATNHQADTESDNFSTHMEFMLDIMKVTCHDRTSERHLDNGYRHDRCEDCE